MNRKQFTFVILTICVSMFVACVSPSTGKVRKVIVKAIAYGERTMPEGESWLRIVDRFERENPNIDIEFELLYDEAYHRRVLARLQAGDIPDIAYMGTDVRWAPPWQSSHQQYDHRPVIDSDYYDLDLIPPMGPNGEIFEIPLGTSSITSVLFMNKKLVKSLGFSVPKKYEDLVAMVERAGAAGLAVVTIDGADGWAWASCLVSTLVARLSGDRQWVSKAVAGEFRFTDEAFVDALAFIPRMIDDGVIPKNASSIGYGENISLFNKGKALFMIQGHWAARSLDKKIAENTLTLAFPKIPGEQASAAGSVAAAVQVGYGLTKAGADNPVVRDAAMMFLTYFNSREETEFRLREGLIMAPILKNFKMPDNLPPVVRAKLALGGIAKSADVIDAYLSGPAVDALNAGLPKIAAGTATAVQIATEIETLLR